MHILVDSPTAWYYRPLMDESTKNPAAVALGILGGKARSEAKARAARENWKKARPGLEAYYAKRRGDSAHYSALAKLRKHKPIA